MSIAGVSLLAVVLAAIASFMFGGAWYGILSRQWMEAAGKTEQDLKSGSLPALLATTMVCQLVMALVLGWLMRSTGLWGGAGGGITMAAIVWLGFVATTLAVNHGYQGARSSLTVIDGLHWLFVLLIQGAVLGWMGAR